MKNYPFNRSYRLSRHTPSASFVHSFTMRDIVLTLDKLVYQNFVGGAEFRYDPNKISHHSVNLCEEHFAYVIRELIWAANGVDVIYMEAYDDTEYFYFKAHSSVISSISEEAEEALKVSAEKAGLEYQRDENTVTLKAVLTQTKITVRAIDKEDLYSAIYRVFFGCEYRKIKWQ